MNIGELMNLTGKRVRVSSSQALQCTSTKGLQQHWLQPKNLLNLNYEQVVPHDVIVAKLCS